jgi:DNA modification methylase
MTWEIRRGDVLARLAELPSASAHCCVTSPPYWGLRDYGMPGQIGLEGTPEEFVGKMVEVFREVRRVLRGDGTLWLNVGDSYSNATVGQRDGGNLGDWKSGGRREPNVSEPTTLRVSSLPPKNLVGIPWRLAFALQADGWYLRSDIIWAKPNPMPESVTDRPTKSHEYLFLLSKSERYYYDAEAIREPNTEGTIKRLSSGPFQPIGAHGTKASISRSDAGGERGEANGRNKRTVWTIATEGFSEAHFATFPTALVRPCVLAGCPHGGTVLDPFSGAGTTGLVAVRYGRNYIGIELNPEYAEMSERRIAGDAPLFNANVTSCTTFSEA